MPRLGLVDHAVELVRLRGVPEAVLDRRPDLRPADAECGEPVFELYGACGQVLGEVIEHLRPVMTGALPPAAHLVRHVDRIAGAKPHEAARDGVHVARVRTDLLAAQIKSMSYFAHHGL